MTTLFAALSAGAKTYLLCNLSIFFFSAFTDRLSDCLYKCGCVVKFSTLMSTMRKNWFFQVVKGHALRLMKSNFFSPHARPYAVTYIYISEISFIVTWSNKYSLNRSPSPRHIILNPASTASKSNRKANTLLEGIQTSSLHSLTK